MPHIVHKHNILFCLYYTVLYVFNKSYTVQARAAGIELVTLFSSGAYTVLYSLTQLFIGLKVTRPSIF